MSLAASTVETWAMIFAFLAAQPSANFFASAMSACSSAGVSGVASTPPMNVSSSRSPTQSIGDDRPTPLGSKPTRSNFRRTSLLTSELAA